MGSDRPASAPRQALQAGAPAIQPQVRGPLAQTHSAGRLGFEADQYTSQGPWGMASDEEEEDKKERERGEEEKELPTGPALDGRARSAHCTAGADRPLCPGVPP